MSVETSKIPDFKHEFSRNLISNSVYFLLNFLIGLLIVPFYIDTLGLAAYGIIPLATTFAGYVMLILDSLSGAISRFLTIHIQRSDQKGANSMFNTSLFTIIAFILIFAPVALIFAWFAPDFFNIPDIERNSVFLLFSLIIFSSFVYSLQSPFSAIIFSFNKIHYTNYIAIIRTLLSPCIIVTLFFVSIPSVIHVGIAYFISALVSFTCTIILSRKVYDKIHISVNHFSKDQFFEITSLAKWILVDQIGTMLLLSLSLIIVNKEFGTVKGGEYAIVLVFFHFMYNITGLITSLLSPMFYTYYARGLSGSIHRLSIVSVKCIGLVMALPIALICIFSPQLLTLWVGEEFAHLSTIIWILLIPLTMILSFRPLIISFAAYNQVKVPAFFTIISGILNLILAVVFSYFLNLGLYGIALGFIAALWCRNVIFVPMYAAKVQNVPSALLYRPVVFGLIAYLVLVITGFCLVYFLAIPASVVYIGLISGLISLFYFLVVTRFILTHPERELIRTILSPAVSKMVPRWVL